MLSFHLLIFFLYARKGIDHIPYFCHIRNTKVLFLRFTSSQSSFRSQGPNPVLSNQGTLLGQLVSSAHCSWTGVGESKVRTGWARRAHLLCLHSAAGWMHWFCWVKSSYLVLWDVILLSAGGVMWFVILKSSVEKVVCFSSSPYSSAQWEIQTALRSFQTPVVVK